jgi:two-component sensor histidine kinase
MSMESPIDAASLSETNHRIANSLSLIGSFVHLQSDKLERFRVSVPVEDVRRTFAQVEAQIESVARVHRLLTLADWRNAVDLSRHIQEVAGVLTSALAAEDRIKLVEDLQPGCLVSPNLALSLTTIVAELVTNAIKYAHPTTAGRIEIRCRDQAADWVMVEVADNGPGLKSGFNPKTDGGFGLRFVRNSTEQLGGWVSFDQESPGLRVSVRVPRRIGVSYAAAASAVLGAPDIRTPLPS